ncbi:unnamed protein product [Phytomonas sp. Hart1]|nr:unnamed protein product [Phytomonas sp. Hart1]|eukprot:CCW71537.1 unnamed protein product [Phytomonas sp. isolate Hart1]
MFFCPYCGTLLLIQACVDQNQFSCTTCNYVQFIPLTYDPRSVLNITHSFHDFKKVCGDDVEPSKAMIVSGNEGGGSTDNAKIPVSTNTNTDGVIGSAEGGQIMTINCPNEDPPCSSEKAFYIQIQMRSADEPATIFFKCVQCGHQWRQD